MASTGTSASRRHLASEAPSEANISPDDLAFLIATAHQIAALVSIDADVVHELAGNWLVAVKMLVSHYEKLEALHKFQLQGKAKF